MRARASLLRGHALSPPLSIVTGARTARALQANKVQTESARRLGLLKLSRAEDLPARVAERTINEAADHGGGAPLQEAKTGQPAQEER